MIGYWGSMQMSMRKYNSHTILQNYPLWCCCHVMYKLLYPVSVRVRTAPPVSVRVRVRVSVSLLRCNAIAHTVLHVPRAPGYCFEVQTSKVKIAGSVSAFFTLISGA